MRYKYLALPSRSVFRLNCDLSFWRVTLVAMGLLTIIFGALALASGAQEVMGAPGALQWERIMRYVRDKSDLTRAEILKQNGVKIYPHYSNPANTDWEFVSADSWVSGFFAGQLWYTSEWSKAANEESPVSWAPGAQKFIEDVLFTKGLESQATRTDTHDIGFKIFLSYGLGYEVKKNPAWKEIVLTGAQTLAGRYIEKAGIIKSWDHKKYNVNGSFPVITDNLMNLEILFWAAKESGNKNYYDIATSHLDKTIADFFQEKTGCAWHRINYDGSSGKKIDKSETGYPQGRENFGYGDDYKSVWSRGQAWVIYGFTMAYRYTKNPAYLKQAQLAGKCFMDGLKENGITDFVPPFDFKGNKTELNRKYRDSSATAITASAFAELSKYQASANNINFRQTAEEMVDTLYTKYSAPAKEPFLLLHGESHYQMKVHDRALIYGDFYFTEAVLRLGGYFATVSPKK